MADCGARGHAVPPGTVMISWASDSYFAVLRTPYTRRRRALATTWPPATGRVAPVLVFMHAGADAIAHGGQQDQGHPLVLHVALHRAQNKKSAGAGGNLKCHFT
jgi:hypothetical protein